MEADNDNVVFYLQPDFQEKMLRDVPRKDETNSASVSYIYNVVLPKLFNDVGFY